MSEEQLSALLAKIKDDAGLRERLKGAENLDAARQVAEEAGFDVTLDDWLCYRSRQDTGLSDVELEGVAAGLDSAKCILPSAASCSVVGNAICVDANTLPGYMPGC